MPAASCSMSSAYMRDSPSDAASSPAASGARSIRAASAPRTIAASRDRGAVASPNSSTMTSKVHRSPRWLQNTPSPSMSNGVAEKRSATPITSAGSTNRNTAFGSTKRRMSHGQAMRSTFGLERVRRHAGVPEPSGDALAELQPLLADDDGGAACGEFGRPFGDVAVRAPHRARHEARVAGEVLLGADVDEGRAIGPADQAGELFRRDDVWRRHGVRPR